MQLWLHLVRPSAKANGEMDYIIDKESNITAYMQLYYMIRQDIVAGIYKYGDKIPSKRTIASETGLSVIPVEHALSLLCEEGYIESRPRSGNYVVYRESDFESAARLGNMPLKNTELNSKQMEAAAELSSAAMQFSFDIISKTMRRTILDFGERIMSKSENSGCMELKIQICEYLARSKGMKALPEQIIIGSGAEYMYGLIVQLISAVQRKTGAESSGNEALIFALEDPSYDKIRRVYEAVGVKCDMLRLTEDGISSEELMKTGAQVLHVTPFNSYPSGTSVSISKKMEYLNWASQHKAIIVEDNYDSELTISKKAEESLFAMTEEENVIYVNTFSRTISPALRAGYMIMPMWLRKLYEERLGFYSCTVPTFEQYLLAELLRNGDFERHINRVRRNKRKLSSRQLTGSNASAR